MPEVNLSEIDAFLTANTLAEARAAVGIPALDTDATMAANSDTVAPSQKAVKTGLAGKAPAHSYTFSANGEVNYYNWGSEVPSSALSDNILIRQVIFKEGVANIGPDAFLLCTELTSVDFPESLEIISQGAFSGCTGLTAILFPDSVNSIGPGAFANCTSLMEIQLAGAVTTISDILNAIMFSEYGFLPQIQGRHRLQAICGVPESAGITKFYDAQYNAFLGCSQLAYLGLPENIESIGSYAFKNCELYGISCYAMVAPTLGVQAFFGANTSDIHVPVGATGYDVGEWLNYTILFDL